MAAERVFTIAETTNDTELALEIASHPTTNITITMLLPIPNCWRQFPATCLQLFKHYYNHQYTSHHLNYYWDGFYIKDIDNRPIWYSLLIFAQSYCNPPDILAHIFASVKSFRNLIIPTRWYFTQRIFEIHVRSLCETQLVFDEQFHIVLSKGKLAALNFIIASPRLDIEMLILYYCAAVGCPYLYTNNICEPYEREVIQKFEEIFALRAEELIEFITVKLRPVPDLQFVEFMLETV